MRIDIRCPDCATPLKKVKQTGGMAMNPDQFDAVKAGDYYCEQCPDNGRGTSGLCYFWSHELVNASACSLDSQSGTSSTSDEGDAK